MRRLGLDIGANSIGWCLIEDDARIVGLGSRIYPNGRDPQTGVSLAVDRRSARAARRRRDRYLRRRSAFLKALTEHGLMPADASEAKLLAECDPYILRSRALDERIEPYEIGRALFHLNQRRGFKSNRKAERKSDGGEGGKIATGAAELDRAMVRSGADTLGQFLAASETKRVHLNSETQAYDFYPQRHHYEYEFDRIWRAQAPYYPALLTNAAREHLFRVLFFQRPLRAQRGGVCTFVTDERRLPKAHPLFQERRLYEEVNQLKVTAPGERARKLAIDERDALLLELRGKRKVSFSHLANTLKFDEGKSFSKASATRTHLRGDEVCAVMSDKKRFGTKWASLDRAEQTHVIERLVDEEDPEKLHAFLTKECGLDDEHAASAAKAPLSQGYGRLGETASRRIITALRDGHDNGAPLTYSQAVEACGWRHSDQGTDEQLDRLPYYGELLTRDIAPGSLLPSDPPEVRWGKIADPTVHIGLRQLEKLINAVITVYGCPDQIVIALARELKLNEKQKQAQVGRNRKGRAAAIALVQKLTGEGFADTDANRVLVRLWGEASLSHPLEQRCPYCGKTISARALLSGEAAINHILPYSRTLDDSSANKVIAHEACSRAKGKRTPFETWGNVMPRWDAISVEVRRMRLSKQWRFGPDAMERFDRDAGFIARQLADTHFLSRLFGRYVSALYPSKGGCNVNVISGRTTATLRRLWSLNSLLPDHNFVEDQDSSAPRNRLDHRHHAIDAAVVALTTRSQLERIAHAVGRAEEENLGWLFEDVPQPWPSFRGELGQMLAAVIVSHKADHGRKGRPDQHRDVTAAKLHDDTAYGFTGEYGPDGKTPVVVKRVPFASLAPHDISDGQRIRDATLRRALQDAVGGRTGPDFTRALGRFRLDHPVFKGIRHLRVLGERAGTPTLNVIPVRDKHGRAYKGYKGNANARFQVWCMPDGKWVSRTVLVFHAHQLGFEAPRPHPAAKKLLDVRKNDLIAIDRGHEAEIMRVVKFSESGQVTLAAHNEGGALKARDVASNDIDPFKYVALTAGGLKKLQARQIRIDVLGRVFDPGPR